MRKIVLTIAWLAAWNCGGANGATLVVGNKGEDTVSFIDLASGDEIARPQTGRAPHEIAVSPDGRTAVVVSYQAQGYVGDTLHIFDVATASKSGEISLGAHRAPHGLKWIPNTQRVIVTTQLTGDVVIVDIAAEKVVGAVETGEQGSHMVALAYDGSRAFVANTGAGSFTVIDLHSLEKIKDVAAGEGTEAISVTPDGKEIWVGANESRSVMIFDAGSLEKVAEFSTEGVPIRVEASPDGAVVAISELDLNRVAIYDAKSRARLAVVELAPAEALAPVTMLFSPDGRRLWVAATGSAKIVEISAGDWTIARTLSAGRGSDGLGYSQIDAKAPN